MPTMDLIEEYLKAVAVLLPRAQRDDIVAELRDMILNRVEAREAELGRPLNGDEIEAVLREIGHPLAVAARYGEGPQHVVGPMLYPYWLFGVKVALSIMAAVAVVIFVATSLGSGDVAYGLGRGIATAVTGSATLIGFATAAAWLIERNGIHIDYLDHWRVKDLKAMGLGTGGWWNAVHDWGSAQQAQHRRRPRHERQAWAAEGREARREARRQRVRLHYRSPARRGVGLIAWGAVMLFWWIGGFHILGRHDHAYLHGSGIDPGALAAADWSQLKAALYWPVLALILAMMAKGAILFVWPRQLRLHGLLDVLSGSALLTLVVWLWNSPPLAPSVQVESVEDFVLLVTGAFGHGPPYALPAMVTLILVATGFAAVCRIVQGLLDALFPGRYWAEPAPVKVNGA
jgi:hypothetical protein